MSKSIYRLHVEGPETIALYENDRVIASMRSADVAAVYHLIDEAQTAQDLREKWLKQVDTFEAALDNHCIREGMDRDSLELHPDLKAAIVALEARDGW